MVQFIQALTFAKIVSERSSSFGNVFNKSFLHQTCTKKYIIFELSFEISEFLIALTLLEAVDSWSDMSIRPRYSVFGKMGYFSRF